MIVVFVEVEVEMVRPDVELDLDRGCQNDPEWLASELSREIRFDSADLDWGAR